MSQENLTYTEILYTELLQVSKLIMFWLPRFFIRFAVCIQHINASIWNNRWGPSHHPTIPTHPKHSLTMSSKAQLVSSKSTCKCMCTPSRKPSRDVLTQFESIGWWFIHLELKNKVMLKNAKNSAWIPNSAAETVPDPSESPRLPMPLTKHISNEAREKEEKETCF